MFHRFFDPFFNGFLEALSWIHESADLQNLCAHAVFRKGRAFKKSTKNREKTYAESMQIWSGKNNAPKLLKRLIWGSLGFIWEGFGGFLALFWALLGALWALLGRSWGALARSWGQDQLQEAFWMDFGSLWKGFGTVWERFGEEFGRIWSLLNKEWSHFGYAWHDLALLQQSL